MGAVKNFANIYDLIMLVAIFIVFILVVITGKYRKGALKTIVGTYIGGILLIFAFLAMFMYNADHEYTDLGLIGAVVALVFISALINFAVEWKEYRDNPKEFHKTYVAWSNIILGLLLVLVSISFIMELIVKFKKS